MKCRLGERYYHKCIIDGAASIAPSPRPLSPLSVALPTYLLSLSLSLSFFLSFPLSLSLSLSLPSLLSLPLSLSHTHTLTRPRGVWTWIGGTQARIQDFLKRGWRHSQAPPGFPPEKNLWGDTSAPKARSERGSGPEIFYFRTPGDAFSEHLRA